MKSLALKINHKLISDRAPSSARATTACNSPVKKSNFGSTPRTITTVIQNPNNRRFSMTVSLVQNCKFDSAQHKDFVVYHESKVDKCLTSRGTTANVNRSPRRDPILQHNDETPIPDFRTALKRLPETDRMATFTEEIKYSAKKQGEFHDLLRARSVSPKIEGIRMCNPYKEHQPEIKKRELKEVDLPFRRNIFNPITEGDPLSIAPIKTRVVHPEPSEEYQKMMNRKTHLPSSLVAALTSPRGRVHRESNKIIGDQIPEALNIASPSKRRQPKKELESKKLIEYSYSPDFRDQGVSGKCTQVPIANLLIKPVPEDEGLF